MGGRLRATGGETRGAVPLAPSRRQMLVTTSLPERRTSAPSLEARPRPSRPPDAKEVGMTRRKAFLAALALCGGLAASAAPLSSAAPTVPPQCGPHPVLTQYEGNYYVWVANPGGNPCWLSVEIPGNIQKLPPVPAPTMK